VADGGGNWVDDRGMLKGETTARLLVLLYDRIQEWWVVLDSGLRGEALMPSSGRY